MGEGEKQPTFYRGKCKVCNSPFRIEYEEQRFSSPQVGVKAIIRYAWNIHQEKFSWTGMDRHMNTHCQRGITMKTVVDAGIATSEEKVVSHNLKILKDINTILDMSRNMLREMISSSNFKEDVRDTNYLRGVTSIMDQFRKAIIDTERLYSRLQIKTEISEEDILRALVEVLKDFPPEIAGQAIEGVKRRLEHRDT